MCREWVITFLSADRQVPKIFASFSSPGKGRARPALRATAGHQILKFNECNGPDATALKLEPQSYLKLKFGENLEVIITG